MKKEIKDFVDGHYDMPDDERLFPIVQEAVQHKMKRQIAKAGVKNIRVHDLRHSHVAYLINKGIEPLLIKERVGHKDIRITLNTYGHLYPNQQRRVADLLDNEKGKAPTAATVRAVITGKPLLSISQFKYSRGFFQWQRFFRNGGHYGRNKNRITVD